MISNEEALTNLRQQREALVQQLEAGQNQLLKLNGAIEVIEQLVEVNKEEETVEAPVPFDFGSEEVDEVTGEVETTEE